MGIAFVGRSCFKAIGAVLPPLKIQSPLPGQAQQEWGWHHGFSPPSTPEREGRCSQEPNPSATSLLWQKVLLDVTPITPQFPGPLRAGDIPVGLPGFSAGSCMDVDGSTAKWHLALFSRPLWSLGVSPGSLGVLTPTICSIHGSVPASVVGNSGKRWTFSPGLQSLVCLQSC